jgi:hypothetical protein
MEYQNPRRFAKVGSDLGSFYETTRDRSGICGWFIGWGRGGIPAFDFEFNISATIVSRGSGSS